MELQVLSCLWILVGSVRHPLSGSMHDDDNCGVLLPQFRKLSLAMDCVLLGRINGTLCISLFDLLLCLQDEYAWLGPDGILLWLHDVDKFGSGCTLWNVGALGRE